MLNLFLLNAVFVCVILRKPCAHYVPWEKAMLVCAVSFAACYMQERLWEMIQRVIVVSLHQHALWVLCVVASAYGVLKLASNPREVRAVSAMGNWVFLIIAFGVLSILAAFVIGNAARYGA